MYERILVSVDGSSTSDLALAEAIKLAAAHHSRLLIVHVVDATPHFSGDTAFIDYVELERALSDSGRKVLDKAAAAARDAQVEAETRLVDMDQTSRRVADVIAKQAASWPADLLVVGTHGRRGLSHLFLGSVAEGMVRISPVPVLLIRGK